ncbi:MAG: DNA-3-methyladenine glycosylase [uncultured Friedmanniella sp.]|uniref:DNA-3-methyladenine glycosylase n=1 Tax=uncultured Friedmanniella sp. TaxID=335381 RepID=A0A6J4LN61_9ACTN|nr:MAG: DNA-3-methyladenine glycosylase [uncultured Friedmanniella sp.]
MSVTAGPDGRLRCPWALSSSDYLRYHDTEWGQPVTSAAGLYERVTLEGFQSGLSWLTILRKRENFRAAFAGFDPQRVADFGPDDVERLLGDAGIVRNRAKIDAAISNARVVADLGDEFARLVWSFAEPGRPRPADTADVPAQTAGSVALARALKGVGIRFFGPTTAYALMQAVGLVDDHLAGCFVTTTPPPATRQ